MYLAFRPKNLSLQNIKMFRFVNQKDSGKFYPKSIDNNYRLRAFGYY